MEFKNYKSSKKIQRSFTTYKWGIMYMMFKTSCNLSYKKNVKDEFLVMIWYCYHLKTCNTKSTKNLCILSIIHIYSKMINI
jgi:hypothetical protein